MADLSQDQLRQLCEALGWQGGTFWQVLDEVKQLRSRQLHLSALLKCMEQFTNEMTVGERYSNAGQAALDSLPVLREAVTSGVNASPDSSAWWALVMGAAASIEDAANCLRDPDAKKRADGAAKHYREAAQKLMAAAGVAGTLNEQEKPHGL